MVARALADARRIGGRVAARECQDRPMSQAHELRCYDYINQPYVVVRDALRADLAGICERATKGAAGRAHALAASLKVDLGAFEIGTDVHIEVTGVAEHNAGALGHGPTTVLELSWRATRAAGLFPSMRAELTVYPLSKDETQIELHGRYTPPLGVIGSALDSLIGHRVADASVHRFVDEVARQLRDELAGGSSDDMPLAGRGPRNRA
jgi:hypothetical protein